MTRQAGKKPALKGVMAVRKRLSGGTKVVYWYHRTSKTRLPGEYGSPEFLAAYIEADRGAPKAGDTV